MPVRLGPAYPRGSRSRVFMALFFGMRPTCEQGEDPPESRELTRMDRNSQIRFAAVSFWRDSCDSRAGIQHFSPIVTVKII